MFRNNTAELLAAGYNYHSNTPGLRHGGTCTCCGGRANEKVDMDQAGYIRAALIADERSPFTPAQADVLAMLDTDTLRQLRDSYLGAPRANVVLAVNAEDPAIKAMASKADVLREERAAAEKGRHGARVHRYDAPAPVLRSNAEVMAAARGYTVAELLGGRPRQLRPASQPGRVG